MRSIMRISGIIVITLALIFFLYGSMKTARAEAAGSQKVDMGGGLVAVQDNAEQQRADSAFNIALFTGLAGSLLLFGSFAIGKPNE